MEVKDVYLVVKTTFRDNKFLFRQTMCVCSNLDKACSFLGKLVKDVSRDECVKVRPATFGDWFLATKYRNADLVEIYEDYFFHIFKMQIDALGSGCVDLSLELFNKIKDEIYGNK